MRVRVPVIHTASDTPGPTRDRLWDKLKTEAEKDFLIGLMRRRGNSEWNPGEVIEIETPREIVKLMEERPIDRRGER